MGIPGQAAHPQAATDADGEHDKEPGEEALLGTHEPEIQEESRPK